MAGSTFAQAVGQSALAICGEGRPTWLLESVGLKGDAAEVERIAVNAVALFGGFIFEKQGDVEEATLTVFQHFAEQVRVEAPQQINKSSHPMQCDCWSSLNGSPWRVSGLLSPFLAGSASQLCSQLCTASQLCKSFFVGRKKNVDVK